MPTLDTINPEELIEQLERLVSPGSCLAFDGDGTLWSGDVGDSLFRHAIDNRLLKSTVTPYLLEAVASYQLPSITAASDCHDIARTVFDAYRAGTFPERLICEIMTWCYAGYREDELQRLTEEVLHETDFAARRHQELQPLLAWARSRGLRCIVVSASPEFMVKRAARVWDFDAADVIASTPAREDNTIQPGLAFPIPYAAAKCDAARRLASNAHWLAAFGDNIFDLEMLQMARVGVLVRPKPALLLSSSQLTNGVLLASAPPTYHP